MEHNFVEIVTLSFEDRENPWPVVKDSMDGNLEANGKYALTSYIFIIAKNFYKGCKVIKLRFIWPSVLMDLRIYKGTMNELSLW